MNNYPTDLTDNQWQSIEKFFDYKRKRKHSLRSIMNAILYVVKTGCQWRMLPKTFARWELVYYYFREWKYKGIIESILEELVYKVRKSMNRSACPSACIVDSQSVRTSSISGFCIGYDAGKKIKGRKRHIATDTLGNLLVVEVHSASVQDRAKGFDIMSKVKSTYKEIEKIFADGGYTGQLVKRVKENLKCQLEIVKRTDKEFKVLPKRWVVERTLAWISNDRRNSKDYEFSPLTSETIIQLSFIKVSLNRLFN
jgi:putative transposase